MAAAVALRPRQTTRQVQLEQAAPLGQQPAAQVTQQQPAQQPAAVEPTREPASASAQAGARQAAQARVATASHRISGSYVPAPSLDQVRNGNAQVRRGQQGESVSELQTRLNANGANPPLEVDGKFGPRTQEALRGYQKSRDITDTGVLGRTTLNALDQNRPAANAAQQPANTQQPGNTQQPAREQAPATTEQPRANASTRVDTSKMTEAQKYDHYKNLIEQNGGKFKDGANQRNIVSLRNETSTKANNGQGVYDDKTVMLWKDKNGNKHVREYKSNTDPSSRYEGRYGDDVNRDGRLDLGRARPGYYEYRTGTSSTLGNVLRPTQNMTVDRDVNHDGRFNDNARSSAGQSILFHAGGNSMTGSAGCQTMPPGEYARFWRDLHTAGNPGTIGYTLINN